MWIIYTCFSLKLNLPVTRDGDCNKTLNDTLSYISINDLNVNKFNVEISHALPIFAYGNHMCINTKNQCTRPNLLQYYNLIHILIMLLCSILTVP